MSLGMRVGGGMVLLAAGMLPLAWAYTYGGGAEPGLLDRAGTVVTWALPAAKLVFNLASAGAIGALVLAVFALPRNTTAYEVALRFSGWSAVIWAAGAAVFTAASFLFIANRAPSAGFGEAFLTFLTEVDAGRSGALTTLIAAAVALSCFRLRTRRLVALTVVAAFTGLVPLVLKSHAAGGADHADSTMSILVHAAAAAVWLGGLLVLVVLRPALPGAQFAVTARRYSTLALVSFIALAVSGLLAALARISSVDALLSPYGVIVLAKAGVFVVLGLFGVFHRRRSLKRMELDVDRNGRYFAVLAVVELAVMAAASGMAAALARTEPPQVIASGELDSVLPVPVLSEAIFRWGADPLWSLACGFAVFAYLAGVRRVRTSGQPWPARRTVFWLAGVTVLFIVTNGGVHVYQSYLFNAHVLTQMILTAVVPLLLVPAAPLTLAKLAVRDRTDGSAGVNEVLERAVQPVVAALRGDQSLSIIVLAASLLAIYRSPLLEWSAAGQIGYSAMTLLSLLGGSLVTAALTGNPDPDTAAACRKRLTVVAGIAAVYAFSGWKLMELAPELELPWYLSIGRPWGASPAAAADLGGPLMWSIAAVSVAVTTAMVTMRRVPAPGNKIPDPPPTDDNTTTGTQADPEPHTVSSVSITGG